MITITPELLKIKITEICWNIDDHHNLNQIYNDKLDEVWGELYEIVQEEEYKFLPREIEFEIDYDEEVPTMEQLKELCFKLIDNANTEYNWHPVAFEVEVINTLTNASIEDLKFQWEE